MTQIEHIIDLSQYLKCFFEETYKVHYSDNYHQKELLINNLKDRINTIIIYSDDNKAYSILLYLIEIFNDMIKIGRQPWSYKNVVNITNWIVNKLVKNCIFSDNLLTNEIYKFGCMIGNYKLIKCAFDNKFHPDHMFIAEPIDMEHNYSCNGLYYVLLVWLEEDERIKIYNLFIEYGFNTDNLIKPIQYKSYCCNILERAFYNYMKLTERILRIGCDIDKNSLHDLARCIGFYNPKKMKNKNRLKYVIDTIISKTLEKYGTLDIARKGYMDFMNTPLAHLCRNLYTYHNHVSHKFVNKWYIINKETIVEYFIKQLIIYGVNIGHIIDIKNKIYMDEHGKMIYNQFQKMITNKIIPRKQAIEFVRNVNIGTGILPDIANVVFDHYSEFRQNNHYDLAANAYNYSTG
jgi:hypothetical protein